MFLHNSSITRLVQIALAEDLGDGDVTSEATIAPSARGTAAFLMKQHGMVCGLPVVKMVFDAVDARFQAEYEESDESEYLSCTWEPLVEEGSLVQAGTVIARVEGLTQVLLIAERTALNFLQRMSGVATQARIYADAVEGTNAKVIDTRKTIPGWRLLDKYAVVTGGGANHRIGLYDMAMIKDNHRDAAGSITNALMLCNERRNALPANRQFPIEVETRDLVDVHEVLQCWAAGQEVHRIMFDNFTPFDVRRGVVMVREATRERQTRIETEASGGITLHTIRKFAETGVDFISVGALTHSAPAIDISMKIQMVH
jgi:nicotinate-nucleotide pyrophosphorylase (carboxylating)